MPEEGDLVVVEPSDSVAPGKLALDGDSLAKAGLAEGTPVEISANGKKLALIVERGGKGAAAINASDAESIGVDNLSLARMRKIRPREIKAVTLEVIDADVPVDPAALRLHLALKPISEGSIVTVTLQEGVVKIRVKECEPGEGIVSYNTVIKLTY